MAKLAILVVVGKSIQQQLQVIRERTAEPQSLQAYYRLFQGQREPNILEHLMAAEPRQQTQISGKENKSA